MSLFHRRLQVQTPHGELSTDAPIHRHGKLVRVIKAVLPLIIIGGLVYVAFNFPALKNEAQYAINKPKAGNSNALPPSLKPPKPGAPAPAAVGGVPVGGPACGRPVSYDNKGNPKAICDGYVYIPKIGVASPMSWPASTNEATINDSLLKGIVHYPGTAEPGQKGNVFLTGHSSFYWWVQSEYRTVFTLLPKLVSGDEIIVYHQQVRYTYRVTELHDVKPNDTQWLRPTAKPTVTLSTCIPIGTSYLRRIVRAEQVTPDPAKNRAASPGAVTPGRLPGVR